VSGAAFWRACVSVIESGISLPHHLAHVNRATTAISTNSIPATTKSNVTIVVSSPTDQMLIQDARATVNRKRFACRRGCRPQSLTPTVARGLPRARCPKLIEQVGEPFGLANSHGQLGMTEQPDRVETLDRTGKRNQDPSRSVRSKR